MFRFYDHFYAWGQIEPNNLNEDSIIEKEIFGHFVVFLLFPKWRAFYLKMWKTCEKQLILEHKVH